MCGANAFHRFVINKPQRQRGITGRGIPIPRSRVLTWDVLLDQIQIFIQDNSLAVILRLKQYHLFALLVFGRRPGLRLGTV